MLLLNALTMPGDNVIGSVTSPHGPVLLVVRGDCAGFVLELESPDFFEIMGDGSDIDAVEQAMNKALAAREAQPAARRQPRAG